MKRAPGQQAAAGKKGFQQHGETICPLCDGSGRVLTRDWKTRSRKGGNASYRKSTEPGELSMAERGRLGGRPKALTLEDLRKR